MVPAPIRSLSPLVNTWPGPQHPAQEVAVPARPTGQTAVSAAQSLDKFGAPLSRGGWRRRCASRGACGAR
eukprot:15436192-Alexandrium_andersonii.AAC.1